MRPAGHTSFVIPALLLALTAGPALADVQVDLSAIGGPTDADARIAPGKAPVQLRYPGAETTPSTRILLTPPASVRQAQEAQREAPRVLGPSDATVVDVAPAPPAPPPTEAPTSEAPTAEAPTAEARVAPVRISPPAPQPAAPQLATQAPQEPVERARPTPTPTPPLVAAPTPPAPEPSIEVASLPSPQSANHRLRFEGTGADILGATRDELEMVATELMRHDDRIEIQAFAGKAGDTSSDARRMSLRRALNVRKFLVERGVLQSRIDVRALGGVRDNGPADRVDILLSRR